MTGMLTGGFMSQVVVADPIVTITDIGTINEIGAGVREMRLRFNTDGTIDLFRTSTGYVQQNSSSDWIIPNESASGDYQVRCASLGGGSDTWTTEPASVGNWVALTAAQEWIIQDTDSSAFVFKTISNAVFEIRLGTGSPLDSGTMGNWVINRNAT